MICFQKIEKSLDVTPVGAESAIITVVQFSNVLRIEGRLPKETLFDLGIARNLGSFFTFEKNAKKNA